ncbi:hypothetical protein niasHT_018372 [Heterodera trifolii]|uniref:MULE transposase domain-containing protein n=1 Tax=Heterodera trifolii TaxID=157864 RepID=A0ABD2LDJ7_9BILA
MNCKQNTYLNALRVILCHVNGRRPDNIIIDFEKSVENIFRNLIPTANIHGCFFHFSQAIWRKAQHLGLERRYVADEDYRTFIKMFTALSFCPTADVAQHFNSLSLYFINSAGNDQAHLEFIDYFESTWIGRPTRRPMFQHEMWNNREITIQHLTRTTNSVESWHHQIQAKFLSPHPNIFAFIGGIREEIVRVNAISVKLDCGQEPPLYSRAEYRQANERLLTPIGRYHQMDTENFLQATSKFVKFRGVDPVRQQNEEPIEDD